MKKMSDLYKKAIVLLMGVILVAGLTGCATKELCLHPGCDNERIDGTGACYKHEAMHHPILIRVPEAVIVAVLIKRKRKKKVRSITIKVM